MHTNPSPSHYAQQPASRLVPQMRHRTAGRVFGLCTALAAGFWLQASPAMAAPQPVQVVGVSDGDTVKVLLDGREQKLRLAEIDAPEKAQPFGQASKSALLKRCMGKKAAIDVSGTDRYGRLLGRLTCGGEDANAAQVRDGLAWVYDDYVRDQSLYRLQAAAKSAKRGLWSEPDPQPPWAFRRAKRDKGRAGGGGR